MTDTNLYNNLPKEEETNINPSGGFFGEETLKTLREAGINPNDIFSLAEPIDPLDQVRETDLAETRRETILLETEIKSKGGYGRILPKLLELPVIKSILLSETDSDNFLDSIKIGLQPGAKMPETKELVFQKGEELKNISKELGFLIGQCLVAFPFQGEKIVKQVRSLRKADRFEIFQDFVDILKEERPNPEAAYIQPPANY